MTKRLTLKSFLPLFLFLFTFIFHQLSVFGESGPGRKLDPSPNSVAALANNECSGAISISLGNPINDNNTGATQSMPPNQCNGFASPNANDVWYTFNYTAEMDSVVVVPGFNPANDIIIELFSGSCGNLTFLACSNFAEQNSNIQTEGINLASLGLSEGTSYKLRVYGYNGVVASWYVLLKEGSALPPPANDECSSPQTLIAGSNLGTTSVGATQSIAPVTCQGFTSTGAKDVWYRFQKTNAMDSLALYPSTTGVDFVVEVRSNNCASGTSLLCSDRTGSALPEKISLSGLTTGTIYLVRVYARNGTTGEFTLRIKTNPSNNNCVGARELLPSANQTAGGTVDASQSLPASSCLGTPDDDVWYKFTMAAGMDTVTVTPVGFFNPVVELRSGNCASTTAVRCSNGTATNAIEKLYVGNLTDGTTYYIRIYSFGAGEGAEGSFFIRLNQVPPAGPANDNCTSPISISSGSVINGTNLNATQTAPGVACGGGVSTIVKDVWYQFTKTDLIDTVKVDGLGTLDLMVDVRANSCPNGSVTNCLDEPGTDIKKLPINDLTNGTIYLLRIYGREGATGNFSIEFLDANIVVNPPANDECFDAVPLTVGASCSGTAGTNVAATESQPASSACSGNNPGTANDVWYTFTANATRAIVKLTCNPGLDGAIQVYSGNCFGLTSIGCADKTGPSNDPDFPAVEEIFLQGLISGQQYYFRVYGKGGTTGTFATCVYNPNCNSTAAVLTSSSTSILSNQSFATSVASGSGEMAYESSSNQTSWTSIPAITGLADTLRFTSATTSTIYLRLSSRTGNCYPAYSNVVELAIRCATPITNPATTDRINKITFGSINQTSTTSPLGGNVQDFSQVSTPVCKGNTYALGITANSGTTAYNRMAWIDFNQDGDFADAGENVLSGPYVAGALVSSNITIPANAPAGSCRMRVALINNGAAINSSDPCAAGPYANGEIEEYTLNVTSGLLANAGSNQSVCAASATLAGNDPGVGATGKWTVVSGTGTFTNDTQFGTTVSNLSPGANVFRWTITNTCGNSQSEVTITSTIIPSNAGPDQSVCATTATLAATAPVGGSGSWSVLSGGGSVTAQAQANSGVTGLGIGVNQFIWTVSPAGPGCPSTKDTVKITRKSPPVASVGPDQSACGPAGTLSATTPISGTGAWSLVSGAGTITNASQANSGVTGLGFGPNTFRWTVTDAPCAAATAEQTLTNNLPAKPNAGTDRTVCAVNAVITATNIPTGLSGTWTSIGGTATVAVVNSTTANVSNLAPGVNRFGFFIPVPACSTQISDTVALTREVNPIDLGIDTILCIPANPIVLNGPPSMTSYSWNTGGSTQQISVTTGGKYRLSVVTPNGCTFRDSVVVLPVICTGLKDVESAESETVVVVPNPSRGSANLDLSLNQAQDIQIRVLDMKGSVIADQTIRMADTKTRILLPEPKSSGIYLLRIQGREFNRTIKWVVQD